MILWDLVDTLRDRLRPRREMTVSRAAEPLGARNLLRRRERLSEGYLSSERMIVPRPCTLRDMTVLGCRVDLWDDVYPSLLKAGVTLYISKDKKEVEAEVVWRKSNTLGLRFTSGFRTPKRTYKD